MAQFLVSTLGSCFQSGWPPDEHLKNRVLVGPSVISIIIGSTIFRYGLHPIQLTRTIRRPRARHRTNPTNYGVSARRYRLPAPFGTSVSGGKNRSKLHNSTEQAED